MSTNEPLPEVVGCSHSDSDSSHSGSSEESESLLQLYEFLNSKFSLDPLLQVKEIDHLTWERLAPALVALYLDSGKADRLVASLKSALVLKIQETETESLLFRDESPVISLFMAHTRAVASDLLVELNSVIEELAQEPLPTEVDPLRLAEGDNAQLNQQNLLLLSNRFLQAILSASYRTPRATKEMLKQIYETAEDKFAGSGFKALGGLLFLRFFCPAIVNGHKCAAKESMGPTFRRSLILAAKILQALASQAKFEKEAYMLPFTTFTEENIPRVHTFFLSMLEEESDLPRSKTTPLASSCPSLPLRVSSSVDIKYSSTSSWPLRSKLQPLAITTFYTTPQPDSYLREHLLALAQCFQKHFDALRKYCLNEEAADALEQILLDIMEEEEERKQAEADSDESDDAKHARKSKLRKGRTFSMERLLGMKLEPDFEKKKRSLKTVSMDDLRTDKASLPCRPVEHWSKSDVGFWLASIGKPEYVSLFKKQGINGSRLMELTDKNKLMALGVKHLGHRKQISQEIVAQLSTNGEEFVNSESSFAATMSVEEDSWVGRKIIEWTTDDVLQWISYHEDLSEYGKLLKKHKVDGKALTEITIQELTDIGVKKLGHKKKLLKLVRERQQDPEAALYEKEIDIWSYAEVADWLYAVGLGQYHKLFHAHRVTGKLLLLVEEADLVDVGMTQLGHRKKFLKHQQLLKQRLSHRSSPVKTNATV